MTSDSVGPGDARRQLGKTCRMAVQGGQRWIPQLVLSANTHCRFRHLWIGSPYKSYVKLALSLALGLGEPAFQPAGCRGVRPASNPT